MQTVQQWVADVRQELRGKARWIGRPEQVIPKRGGRDATLSTPRRRQLRFHACAIITSTSTYSTADLQPVPGPWRWPLSSSPSPPTCPAAPRSIASAKRSLRRLRLPSRVRVRNSSTRAASRLPPTTDRRTILTLLPSIPPIPSHRPRSPDRSRSPHHKITRRMDSRRHRRASIPPRKGRRP
jgi:hypothetical protein